MSYQPQFTITPALLARVEQIAALRERILAGTVQVRWIPALQKDTRTRNTHSSTAIEGNPLTLEQVRAVEEGLEIPAVAVRAKREVVNYFAGLRFVEKNAAKKIISHEEILRLHKIMAGDVMDQGTAGRYRTMSVRVGRYIPDQIKRRCLGRAHPRRGESVGQRSRRRLFNPALDEKPNPQASDFDLAPGTVSHHLRDL